MAIQRYWVIGGRYSGVDFRVLADPQQVEGPFQSQEEAQAVWKRLSAQHSNRATVRFSIASEQLTVPA